MRWSWKLGTVAGIAIRVHATFVFLLAWIGFGEYSRTASLVAASEGIAFVLALFGIVVLHELGHAFAARRYGIRTRDITLLPVGGVARLEKIPEEPTQELVIALAGPLVNVVLATFFFAVLIALGLSVGPEAASGAGGGFLPRLAWSNVVLALFNLLPAFPMDGGRVLRALLATRLDRARATRIAASIGQAMAVLFGLVGLVASPVLVLVALFVWVGAAGEAAQVELRGALAGTPVRAAMITELHALAPRDRLGLAADLALAGFQQDFPVVEGGALVGVLPRSALLRGVARAGLDAPVGAVMLRPIAVASPDESLEDAFVRLQGSGYGSLPVVLPDGTLVGVLTPENVDELLLVRSALRGYDASRSPTPLEGALHS